MFERYTQQVRKARFLAAHEASQSGRLSIGTEHLLLGLLDDNGRAVRQLFERQALSLEHLRTTIAALPARRGSGSS
jgi:ATP-dependent Clp protease ATP-binding subunit ClpA